MENDPPTTKTESPHAVTAIIIAKNEEEMVANCLDTLTWADSILLLDTGSTDRTKGLARRAGAEVIQAEGKNFAQWRNEAAKHAAGAWLFYVDADERVTPALAKAIQSRVRRPDFDAYTLRRNNVHYGKWMQHGGWQTDVLLRLMRKDRLKSWVGEVHEHAEISGRIGAIEEPLVHLTHRSLFDGLRKSAQWTDTEARLLLSANHPPVGPLRILKIVVFDFLNRVLLKLAWKDGQEGVIEAMVQTMNRFLVYARLWELQQKPAIPKRYELIEEEIQKQWRKP